MIAGALPNRPLKKRAGLYWSELGTIRYFSPRACCNRPRQPAPGRRGVRIQPLKLPGSAELPARWRHLAHLHGSNVLGGLMVTIMFYAFVLTLLAS